MIPIAAPPPWAARVLVVEDDLEMRSLLVDLLVGEGCSVQEVSDGQEAIRLLHQDAADYDLVITDLRMPGVDGLDLAGAVDTHPPAVVLISAFVDGDVARRAASSGVSAVLAKPFSIHRLLGVVRALIGPL